MHFETQKASKSMKFSLRNMILTSNFVPGAQPQGAANTYSKGKGRGSFDQGYGQSYAPPQKGYGAPQQYAAPQQLKKTFLRENYIFVKIVSKAIKFVESFFQNKKGSAVRGYYTSNARGIAAGR